MESEQKKSTLVLILAAVIFTSFLCGCVTDAPTYTPENIDEYVEQLDAISSNQVKQTTLNMYSYVGMALFVAGVGTLAWTARLKSGLYMLIGGIALMASVWIFDSPWFDWIVGIAAGAIVIDILYIVVTKTLERFKPPSL
jgi:hypothetical protein